ncbi:RNA-binding protein [Methylobacterium terrae]|uniref:RNA-binding protein n=1 Tax=Methylobacterium terrae TaxID=2202827 RepID=A0A2U8WY92_9HYPH|nr:S1 RNA-binding domain-containing protein [Methylobacterium terrae]AWN50272.1 RNA-binding protein [Methylobacterium terrae]
MDPTYGWQEIRGAGQLGLNFDPVTVQTKKNLRRFAIGKGAEKKSYIPDYVVTIDAFPILICEGKGPGANLDEAFREARLYAGELNAVFETDINPVRFVMATDGFNILAGYVDSDTPKYRIDDQNISLYSDSMANFVKHFGLESVVEQYKIVAKKTRPRRFWKPNRLIGGSAITHEEISYNSFGANITTDFSHIFKPLTLEDRATIAKHAYVPSKRRERYVEPIDRIIRAAAPVSEARSKTVEDTAAPKEVFRAMRRVRKLEHEILLIIGSAGAGKTTFVDYLQEVALPRDLRDKTIWIRINMNPAPISRDEIYSWLRAEIISSIKNSCSDTDFDDIDVIKTVNSEKVNAFRKGIGRLYESNKDIYNTKLGEYLHNILENHHLQTINMIKYASGQENKLPLVVLDNCDKRLRDEQLLMFEAAQWLQREFACLVVLPLREETYDNHYNEPPLDTALKDLVFRIEPPLFQRVLQERISLALSTLDKKGKRILSYTLPNGMRVDYPASDQAYYLGSILRSLFEHDRFVRRFIVGLSGRNIRRALEIFLQFCQSGHIPEEEILKIRRSEGQHVLPLEMVTNVLLRLNQRFYTSKGAYLKNIYAIDEHDEHPNYLSRLLILRYLQTKKDSSGPNRLRGYIKVAELRQVMERLGISSQTFSRELETLAKAFCVYTEDFRTEKLNDYDLVSLAPAGFVHLQITDNVHYLATIAEDTWFTREDVAVQISDRIRDPSSHYTLTSVFYNAVDVFNEISAFRDKMIAVQQNTFDNNELSALTDLVNAHSNLVRYERSFASGSWIGLRERHPIGSKRVGKIVGNKAFGLFVDIEPTLTGLVPASSLPRDYAANSDFNVGKQLQVCIARIDPSLQKIGLELI